MKGRHLLFAVGLGCIVLHNACADDVARAARRTADRTTTTSDNGTASARRNTTATRGDTSTGTATTAKNTRTAARTTTTRTGVVGRTGTDDTSSATRAATRQNTTVTSRAATAPVTTRTASPRNTARPQTTGTISRAASAITSRAATIGAKRQPTTPATGRGTPGRTTARAAATNSELRDAVMNRDYKTCRQVYYDCMDEFCANKDAQLKRCACSVRMHDFDKTREQLSVAEDKLLDFNQRLLAVNLDKEDAAAMSVATEGELAFATKDTSDSKKLLDEISKKLNASGTDSFNQNLTAISLSLNADAAFDNIDYMMGADTTTKEGAALYNAALPVCREMAAEVCTAEEMSLVESGYQMTIEQDCNIVAKTYETQTDATRNKIREGAALLDMSRLDIHQKRNSDDILTCKKKMLAQLTETTVCGENMIRCLDISGKYIDPSTGSAFLTVDLAGLSNLIKRPGDNESWTSVPGNDRFVSYLNSKKDFLAPAMENCQDISDMVWDEFMDDALAQIKLAQDAKLEEIRQGCTTLTSQCLTNAADSLSDFDARALSIFGVAADYTAKKMCDNVQTACTALLGTTGGDADWVGGMTEIADAKTYDTIIKTCREVGRACIIQACTSISGNFGMCEDIQTSVNRKSIINRTACWDEVLECVKSAGTDTIGRIFNQNGFNTTPANYYHSIYGGEIKITNINTRCNMQSTPAGEHCIYDICATECGCGNDGTCTKIGTTACHACRITERIWGNCEAAPTTQITQDGAHNKIIQPIDTKTNTLMWWFATNTGTHEDIGSCRDTSCPPGFTGGLDANNNIYCYPSDQATANGMCPVTENRFEMVSANNTNTDSIIGCCHGKLKSQICCTNDGQWQRIDTNDTVFGTVNISPSTMCTPTSAKRKYLVSFQHDNDTSQQMLLPDGRYFLVCVSEKENPISYDTETNSIHCDGTFVYVDNFGHHIDPNGLKSYMSLGPDTSCSYVTGWANWTDPNHVQACDGINIDNINGWHVTPINPTPQSISI